MLGKLFKNLFNSNLDYYPRFIDKDAYKKSIVQSTSDIEDYKELKNTVGESFSPSVRTVYAYAPVRKDK
ncbi:MAG: hypothetical protein PHE78_05690 [Candidatus Gastranaerophilales bacterium]|nr:hypothetical protein [Candidatus Gastranaerophilales bacterium]